MTDNMLEFLRKADVRALERDKKVLQRSADLLTPKQFARISEALEQRCKRGEGQSYDGPV